MWSTAALSNVAFAVPLSLFLGYGLVISAVSTTCVLVASTLYHGSGRARWRALDQAAAWALIANNSWLLAASGGPQPFLSLALLLFALAMVIFYRLGHDDWGWHSCSAGITLLCGLAYVTPQAS